MTGWEGNHRLIDAGECVPASPLGAPVSVQDVSFVVSPVEVLYPGPDETGPGPAGPAG